MQEVAAIFTSTLFAALLVVIVGLVRVTRPPDDAPDVVAARRKTGVPSPETVALLGASIVHGRVSACIASRVRRALGPGVDVVNAGRNGDLAWNVLQRVDAVVRCRPQTAIVLVGSNDVMGSLSPRAARRYRLAKKLPKAPDLAFYRASLDALVHELERGGVTRVALATLPMLGEERDSVENARVSMYNDVVRDVAAQHGATLIDVFAITRSLLGAAPRSHAKAPMLGVRMLLPMLLRGVFGLPFTTIARLFGFSVLVDGVHLTEPLADRVAAAFVDAIRAPAS